MSGPIRLGIVSGDKIGGVARKLSEGEEHRLRDQICRGGTMFQHEMARVYGLYNVDDDRHITHAVSMYLDNRDYRDAVNSIYGLAFK